MLSWLKQSCSPSFLIKQEQWFFSVNYRPHLLSSLLECHKAAQLSRLATALFVIWGRKTLSTGYVTASLPGQKKERLLYARLIFPTRLSSWKKLAVTLSLGYEFILLPISSFILITGFALGTVNPAHPLLDLSTMEPYYSQELSLALLVR